MNGDIQGALAAFRQVGSDAASLKTELGALGTQAISSSQEAALQALATLANRGEALLASGATKARSDRIDALTNQIAGLNSAIAFGADIDATNAKIAALTAERANLLLEQIGDYSDIISPDKVRALASLALRVHDAAEQKRQAAQIIGMVEQVVTAATDVATAIGAIA